jgi:hypothetical protein
MTKTLDSGGWIAGALIAAAFTIAAIASFSGNGVQVEAAGVEMTLKASFDTGLQVVFAAL